MIETELAVSGRNPKVQRGRGNTGNTSYALFWSALDHQNSVRDVLTAAGTIDEHRDYDAFGQITATNSTGGSKSLTALDTVLGLRIRFARKEMTFGRA